MWREGYQRSGFQSDAAGWGRAAWVAIAQEPREAVRRAPAAAPDRRFLSGFRRSGRSSRPDGEIRGGIEGSGQ